jgi:hypothetical protein
VAVAATPGMLKKVKSKLRRRKLKKIVKDHASEIIVGVLMGLLTDIATDVLAAHFRKKMVKKFR